MLHYEFVDVKAKPVADRPHNKDANQHRQEVGESVDDRGGDVCGGLGVFFGFVGEKPRDLDRGKPHDNSQKQTLGTQRLIGYKCSNFPGVGVEGLGRVVELTYQ